MKYITPVNASEAEGLVAQVYSQLKKDFGRVVEPFTLHSPMPSLLAGAWMAARESELVGIVPRRTKEAIAVSVSRLNQCPYCIDAHTIMLRAAGEKNTAKLVFQKQGKNLFKPKMQEITEWALSTLSPDSEIIASPPFEREEAPEIIGTAIFYHYINPLVTIFLGKTPLRFTFLKPQMTWVASRLFKKAVNRPKTPGASLSLLPDRKLPEDLSWANPTSNVAGAYARFAGIIEGIEETMVPRSTREIVSRYLIQSNLKSSKFSLELLRETTIDLDPQAKIATTLSLLTAFSPDSIDKETINAFYKIFPSQNQLIGTIAWTSFTRARIIGKWLNQQIKH